MITCDDHWPGLMDAAEEAVRRVFPADQVCRVRKTGCHHVKVYSKHLTCMFPQHGPGEKHERRIALEDWQQEIVDAHPWEFVRGLIHSDGCRITSWTTRMVGGERKRYTDTLTKVGVGGRSWPGAATRSTCPSPGRNPSR